MTDTVAYQSVCQQRQRLIEVLFPLVGWLQKNGYMPAMYIVANIDFSCVIYTLQQESIQQDHVNSYYF